MLGHFLPFHLSNKPQNQHFEKMKKDPRDIIILDMCTINDTQFTEGSTPPPILVTHSFLEFLFLSGSVGRTPGLGIQHLNHKPVNVFVAWKDVKFQKPHNFLGNKNFNRLLLDLLKIKLKNCSYQNYMVYHFFYEASNMQNIPPLEQMFNKGTDKSLSGLPQ